MKKNIIFTLYNTNVFLSKSLRFSWLYGLATLIFCALLITTIVIDLFIYRFDGKDYGTLFLSVVYIVVFSDLLLIISRVQNRSFIRSHHLRLFPISNWKKLLYSCLLYAMDLKSILYITVIVCFFIYFFSMNMYISAVVSIIVWVLLFTCILVWTGVLYHYFEKYLNGIRGHRIQYLGYFFISIVLVSQIFNNDIFRKVPVISYASNALYSLQNNDMIVAANHIILLIFFTFAPFLIIFLDKIYRFHKKN